MMHYYDKQGYSREAIIRVGATIRVNTVFTKVQLQFALISMTLIFYNKVIGI